MFSYFFLVQYPSLSLKVGIPLAAETPAPVMKTTFFFRIINSATYLGVPLWGTNPGSATSMSWLAWILLRAEFIAFSNDFWYVS